MRTEDLRERRDIPKAVKEVLWNTSLLKGDEVIELYKALSNEAERRGLHKDRGM